MKKLLAAAAFSCFLPAAAGAQPGMPGPVGIASLASFVGQWTCVSPQRPKAETLTFAYGSDGTTLHLGIVGTSPGGTPFSEDVFIVAHAPKNDLYAFGTGPTGWEFSRSPAFDGKTLAFASLQTNDGSSVTHQVNVLGPATYTEKTDVTPPSGPPISINETCTKS
jgi:hypothetical protein